MFFLARNQGDERGSFHELIECCRSTTEWTTESPYIQISRHLTLAPSFADQLIEIVYLQIIDAIEGRRVLNSPNSFSIHADNNFLIRLNFWRPSSSIDNYRSDEVRLFACGMPHDHDFDLLTAGVIGTGYHTEVFEYNGPEGLNALPSNVATRKLGSVQVGAGDVLFLRKNRDIHIQHAPMEFSATINVIGLSGEQKKGQFVFDRSASQAIAIPDGFSSRFIGLIEILLSTGNIEAVVKLISHPGPAFHDWLKHRASDLVASIRAGGEKSARDGLDSELIAQHLPNVVV